MFHINMIVDCDLSAENVLERFGLQEHGPVQMAIDTAVIDYMLPYWAWDTGRLANSAYGATDVGSGKVIYDTPYAAELYYGIRRNGQPINYHTDHNPQAGPFPFERMMADHANDILEVAKQVAGSQ